ncbi:MAG: SUMF1/EgtB/PvdO family nonheme iron enzyme [Candidatus Hydrogenedentes bacterium]|nr:SUMF1/EgtB/PvdO family nonheme iron enzyme [Candidatus Hydrogenedentota bacterium]
MGDEIDQREDPNGASMGAVQAPIAPARFSWRRLVIAVLGILALSGFTAAGVQAWTRWDRYRQETTRYAPAPEGMVFVPAGPFLMGSDDETSDSNERPQREIFVAAFYIDRLEVTNADYQKFDPAHTFPPDRATWPVVKVTRAQAGAYAKWAGKRLPTGAEWEKAARGVDGRRYPWGNDFDPAKANLGGQDAIKPAGSYPAGASPYGAEDMAGNAWEWIEDVHVDTGFWSGLAIERGIIRGGAYAYSPWQGRTSYIGFENALTTCGDLGFRCVKDAAPG